MSYNRFGVLGASGVLGVLCMVGVLVAQGVTRVYEFKEF